MKEIKSKAPSIKKELTLHEQTTNEILKTVREIHYQSLDSNTSNQPLIVGMRNRYLPYNSIYNQNSNSL